MHKFRKKKKIVISYRRDDSAGQAGRIYDSLCQHFGAEQIFIDIDTIEPGINFVKAIEDAVSSCDVLLAIVGRRWLENDNKTTRRIDSLDDFVRLELATALTRGIRVIPVLVQGAAMPSPQSLPEDLREFAQRNALEVSDLHWKSGMERLVNVINRIPPADATRRPLEIHGTIYSGGKNLAKFLGVAGLFVIVVLLWQFGIQMGDNPPANSTESTVNSSPIPTVTPIPTESIAPGQQVTPASTKARDVSRPSPSVALTPERTTTEAKPSPSRTEPALPKSTPKPQHTSTNESGGRLFGTITVDIDPTTGLLAATTCPVIRTKTFIIGQEPRKYCGPVYHVGRAIPPPKDN